MSRLRSLPVEQPCHFRDRLGERSIRTVAGDTVEVLRVCRELASVRVAIRDRVARLSTLRLARFVPVRSTDEVPDDPNGFEIVSDYIPGTRLSDILHAEGARRTVVPTDAALHVVRQLLGALATLHQTRAVTHGAIAPERLIVTPRGHLVVADCVLGLALDRLSFSRAKLWSEFRIPMPPGSDFPRFDQPADIAQIGFVAVALLASRPLEASDYPDRLLSLIDSLTVTDGGDARVPIPKALRAWLKTALKVETRSRFATVRDAQTAFEQALSNRRRPASAENPIKSLVDDPNRARTDGYGETRSTTDAVESRIDVDIPARELLPHASDENWDTDPRGVAPDPPPRFTPPDEALVSQYVGAALRVDDSVNQPPVTLVRHQPGRAGSAAGGATLGWLRRVARATGRAALVVGAATLYGPAWVLRTIGRAALVVGAATLHGPAGVLRKIGRAHV